MTKDNFFSNFYNGNTPFGFSFWFIFIGFNFILQILVCYIYSEIFNLSYKYLSILTILIFIPIQIYTLVGTWRSSKKSNFKIIGRYAIVILLLYNVGNNFLTYIWVSVNSVNYSKNSTASDEEKNFIAENIISLEDLVIYESKNPPMELMADENVNKLEAFYKCYANLQYLNLLLKENSDQKTILSEKLSKFRSEIFRLYELSFNINDPERIDSRIAERSKQYMSNYGYFSNERSLNRVKFYKKEILDDYGYCNGLLKK
jgi:hypothetical protein